MSTNTTTTRRHRQTDNNNKNNRTQKSGGGGSSESGAHGLEMGLLAGGAISAGGLYVGRQLIDTVHSGACMTTPLFFGDVYYY